MIPMHRYNRPQRTVRVAGDICGKAALSTLVIQRSVHFRLKKLKNSHAQDAEDHLHDLDITKNTTMNLENVDGPYVIIVTQEPDIETPDSLEKLEDQQRKIQMQIYALEN